MSRTPLPVALFGGLLLLATGVAAQDAPLDVAARETTPQEAAARFGLTVSAGAPTAFKAEEFEASRDPDGREQAIFRGNVEVEQGGLRILCDWLKATYPLSGEGGPERLVARGNVRILQGGSEARCTEAVYEAVKRRAVCRSADGPAVLRRGEDTVEGGEIVFDLARSTVHVSGGAIVRVHPRDKAER